MKAIHGNVLLIKVICNIAGKGKKAKLSALHHEGVWGVDV
jgi:hypothetical protein